MVNEISTSERSGQELSVSQRVRARAEARALLPVEKLAIQPSVAVLALAMPRIINP